MLSTKSSNCEDYVTSKNGYLPHANEYHFLNPSKIKLKRRRPHISELNEFYILRAIILRRACFCLGLLYMYRSLTVFVTSIPKSNPEYYCDAKYNGNGSLPFKG